jgi:hypothetical protein
MFDATFWTVLIAATLTAVATGLGALPFLFVRRLSLFWVSIANAAAGGFMFAATHSLVAEGVTISPARLVAGMVIGLGGILIGKMLIVERKHASIAGLIKLDARKAMLFIGVMTASRHGHVRRQPLHAMNADAGISNGTRAVAPICLRCKC